LRAGVYGALYGLGIAFLGATRDLPQPYGGLAVVAVLAAMVGGPALGARLIQVRRKRRGGEAEEGEAEGPEALNASIRAAIQERGPAKGWLVKSAADLVYQLLRGEDRLYVVRLGSGLYSDPGRMIGSPEEFRPGRGNASIPLRDILEVRVNPGRAINPYLRIRTHDGTRRFTFFAPTARAEIEGLLEGLPVRFEETGRRAPGPRPRATPHQIKRYAPYRRIAAALSASGGLSAALWLFVDVPYRAFEALSLLFPAAAFALYCACFEALRPMEKESRGRTAMFSWMFPGYALFMRGMTDFNLDAWVQVVPPAAAIFLTAAALFLAFNARKKPEPRRVVSVLLCVAFYAAFAPVHLNNLLDDGSRVETRQAVIVDMEIDEDDDGPDEYVLHVDVQGARRELNTSPELYEALKIGDSVAVETRTGPLGIAYSDARPAD